MKSLCVRGDCVAIDGAFLPHDSSLLVSHIVDDMLVLVDHGLGSHFPFIKRYFPESTVVPLLVNPRSFQSFDLLLKQLHELQDERETIVIASVDWSHYVSEPWALLHDYSAWTLLVNPQRDKERWRKMDVDCPICLSLIDNLSRKDGLYPQFRWRDSSGTIW